VEVRVFDIVIDLQPFKKAFLHLARTEGKTIADVDKEINEGGAFVAKLRDNLRIRNLMNDINDTQNQIDSYDMDEAAKAKRNFDEKYSVEKNRETEMQSKVTPFMCFFKFNVLNEIKECPYWGRA